MASRAARACSGRSASTWAPTPACTAITDIEWATTSCSSWAIRRRSSASTRAVLWRSTLARSSASRSRLSSVSRRARRAIPNAQATVKTAMLPTHAERVEPGCVRDAEQDQRGVDDADADGRPTRRAPRGDGVGEQHHRQRQRALRPVGADVQEDPEAGDAEREQRVATADPDRRDDDQDRGDGPARRFHHAVADVLGVHGDQAEDEQDRGEHAVDGERVERPQSLELPQDPVHESNVPNRRCGRIGPAMDPRVIRQMYIARLATNHLQGDATAGRKSDRWVIPNPIAPGDPTT